MLVDLHVCFVDHVCQRMGGMYLCRVCVCGKMLFGRMSALNGVHARLSDQFL